MEQKVVITRDEVRINSYIDSGWKVVSVTAQHVSGSQYGMTGYFCFVLEREDQPLTPNSNTLK